MTPQEALAQALHAVGKYEYDTDTLTVYGVTQTGTPAILDALPEGWVLVNGDETASWLGEAEEYATKPYRALCDELAEALKGLMYAPWFERPRRSAIARDVLARYDKEQAE